MCGSLMKKGSRTLSVRMTLSICMRIVYLTLGGRADVDEAADDLVWRFLDDSSSWGSLKMTPLKTNALHLDTLKHWDTG